MSANAAGRRALGQIHLRIYTEVGFAARWNTFFQSSNSSTATTPVSSSENPGNRLVVAMAAKQINRRTLAVAMEIDPSFLSKLLSGKKPWPAGLAERITAWLATQPYPAVASLCPGHPPAIVAGQTPLDLALAYRSRGWSVVPQLPGGKHPCVKWKPFQDRLPTEEEIRAWFSRWPHAGIAVVLGPVSRLFVIDVDGPEAHAVLLQRLGEEPRAPKVLSGSRKPHRYHLFFLHPDVSTKAKATPLHEKLEFRGHRGIVIAPPSLHKSGHPYVWAPGQSLDELPLPELPSAIVASLAPPPRPKSRPIVPPSSAADLDGLDASTSTIEFLRGIYAEGPNWNGRLFRAGCDLASRAIPYDQAEKLLINGARPWDDSEAEIARRTIASAFSEPREPSIF